VVLDDYYTWPRSLSVVRRKAVGPALGVPIRLGDEIIGVIGLMRDIPKPLYDDEDLELAEALADEVAVSVAHARMKGERDRQQAFAQRILDSVPTMLLVCNAETTETIVVNQRLLDKTGWTREELIGQPWIERCVPPGWRDSLVEVARSLREQEGGYRFFNPIHQRRPRNLRPMAQHHRARRRRTTALHRRKRHHCRRQLMLFFCSCNACQPPGGSEPPGGWQAPQSFSDQH